MRGVAPLGAVKRSTLQRYLYEAGLGKKQMRRYAEGRETSSGRFCRPHRMELVQGDIKYGPKIKDKDGKLIKTYLSILIDDHSRYILQSEFYDNQQCGLRIFYRSGKGWRNHRTEATEDLWNKLCLCHVYPVWIDYARG